MPQDERLAIDRHLREFDRLGEDLQVIERDLARSALEDEGVKRLMTIPGVDMTIALAIWTPRRICLRVSSANQRSTRLIKGRKRHIVTDTAGNMLSTIVHEANIQDRDGAPDTIASAMQGFPTLVKLFADGAYAGDKLEKALAPTGPALEIVKSRGREELRRHRQALGR